MDSLGLAGLAGDWCGAGVILAGFSISETSWGIAEFTEHPGAENRSQAGLGQDDLSVRVLAKMRLDLPLQCLDLRVEGLQDRHLRSHGGGVGVGYGLRLAQVLGAQRVADRGGLDRDVAATGPLERGGDLRIGEPGCAGWVG